MTRFAGRALSYQGIPEKNLSMRAGEFFLKKLCATLAVGGKSVGSRFTVRGWWLVILAYSINYEP